MLEPRQTPESHEEAFHHMIIWEQAVQYVSCMKLVVDFTRSSLFLSKNGFTAELLDTDFVTSLTSVFEKNMLPSAFKSFSKSISERARTYVLRQVQQKERGGKGSSKHKLGSRNKIGLASKSAETRSDNEGLLIGSFADTGHRRSWERLYQQAKAFNMLSPLDKVLVTICMLERWLSCVKSEMAFTTYDLQPKEALADLYWNLKGYLTREHVSELNNSRLSAAVAEDFGGLHHDDKRVVMLANISYWSGLAQSGLKEYLQEFFHDVHRFWSHDWSQNCATKDESN